MAETIFELLFKYRPLVYERGELAFGAPAPWLIAAALALAAVAVLTYLIARGRTAGRDRVVLGGLRLALLALLLLLLARPVLLVSTVVPQENYLGVLLDDSRSMRIDDGVSRAALVHDAFLAQGGGLRAALGRRFQLRFFRFDREAEPVRVEEGLEFSGDGTHLGRALQRARDELSSLPLTGLVVVSDGADQAPDELEEALLPLRAEGIPVFTVGVGSERFRRDLEVTEVSAPASVLSGSRVTAEVVLDHPGYEGETVELAVERDGRIVGTRQVQLADGGTTTARIDFGADEPGVAAFRFRVPVREGELVDRNNERLRMVTVRDGPEKVLYFEGEPRHEVAFLRRAVADDSGLQLVVLQRTDDDRYLRLGVDSAGELSGGFPRTRAELFRYRALVLGSVEASHFSHDQLAMIEEFVARRGGGLLLLGGRAALAEGGWRGTPVAEALPVSLDARAADSLFGAVTQVRAGREAADHPITRMDAEAPVTPWTELPALTIYNRIGDAKPGATVLLSAGDGPVAGQPVLAQQRYGAGRTAVFGVQDSWLWQMHADLPAEDETHERLWRQLLRWLVDGVPDRVAAALPTGPAAPGEAVEVRAHVRDDRFGDVDGASVVARVREPGAPERELPLEWTGRPGEYAGRFVAGGPGQVEVEVAARRDGREELSRAAAVAVAPSTEEYFGAGMRRDVLERLARETGGRFYPGDQLTSLAEDLAYSERGVTVVEELELWDMPAGFMAILLLVTVEWMYRRRRGLA